MVHQQFLYPDATVLVKGRHDSLPSKGVLGRIEECLEIDPGDLLLRKTGISCSQTLRGSGHWLGKR
jgi:hypothetical protein